MGSGGSCAGLCTRVRFCAGLSGAPEYAFLDERTHKWFVYFCFQKWQSQFARTREACGDADFGVSVSWRIALMFLLRTCGVRDRVPGWLVDARRKISQGKIGAISDSFGNGARLVVVTRMRGAVPRRRHSHGRGIRPARSRPISARRCEEAKHRCRFSYAEAVHQNFSTSQ